MPHKNPIFSKRIQGSVVMFLSFVALVFGFDFDEGQATEMMQQLGIVIGWAWNLYGSIVAQHRLTRDKGA